MSSDPLDRKVLAQDLPQHEELTQKARAERAAKEKADYEAAVKQYEKDEKAAEEQYQKEVAEYNKKLSESAKQQDQYDAEIQRLEAEKQKELADAHRSVWGAGGSRNRSELKTLENRITKDYNSLIKQAAEKQRVEKGYQQFREAYPGQILPRNVAETFRSSPSFSLVGLYEKKMEGKAAQAEYKRQASVQTAQALARKQSVEYHSNIPNMGYISSGLGTERGDAVKPLPDAPIGKKAVETRQRLTNVDTGQSIMGAQNYVPEITITRTETYRETPDGPVLVRNVERTIPEKKATKGAPLLANPLAFVASLDRQNVDAAGKPITPKVQPKSNIEILKETLSRYQALTGEQKAPYKSVLEASLTDEGRRIDPISKLFIEQSALKQYNTRAEAFGLTEAKGRKGIIKKDGKQIFDLETGLGDVTLGRKLGFVYDYNLQRPTEEKPVLFEGSLQYVLSPKVQGPQQPKLEEAKAFPGTLEYAVAAEPKQTGFNKSLENQYNKLGELQEITAKKAKSGDPRDILVQIAYAPSEAMRSIIGAGGSIVNLFEQNIDPITEKQLNLKRTARPAPIIFQSDVAGTVVLPYQFEKGRFDVSFEEYAQRQKQFIEKKGLPAYAIGIGFDYAGLKGVPSLIKTGARDAPKLLSKLAVPVGKKQLITVKGGISVPSKTWDVAEKVGFRKGVKPIKTKIPQIGKVTTQQPVPNPFGKERAVPYNLQKAQQRIVGGLQTTKAKAVQVGSKVKTAIQKDSAFPNRSIIEGRNVELPNLTRPAKPDFSKTLESLRIGFEVKKSAFTKRLSEMDKIYRGAIDQPVSPYNRRLESLGIGLRVKRQEFTRGISNIGKKIPELKTPKGIIKFKKQVSFFAKRTSKGIEKRKENLVKNLSKLKPTIKAPYLPQKTSLEIAKFKQKEKLDATLARMRKVAVAEEKPKVVVPKLSKNFLSRLKRGGISEPWDFKSIVKPFQKPSLRKEFASGIRGAPIGKIKGTTSRKEFARMLTETKERKGIYNLSNISTKAGLGIKEPTVKDLIAQGVSKESRVAKLRDVKALRFPSQIKTQAGFGRKIPTVKELIKEGEFKQSRFIELQKQERFSAPFTKAGFGIKEKSVKELIGEGLYKQKRFEQLQRQERFSAPFTRAGFGIKEKSVKELIGEGLSKAERISRIKNINDLKAPAQTIKPIFPVPRKPTELENILEGFKKEKPKGQPYKKVRIDKYVPKYPKEWEKWRGVGIVTAAGTITALGLGQEKAEALPLVQIGKIAGRTVESGGQILIYPEIKGGSKSFGSLGKTKSPSLLVPPTLKETQREDDEELTLFARPKTRQVLTVLPKVSFEFSTPQRVQESIRSKIIQPAKITIAQKPRQATRQRQRSKTIQVPKYEIAQIQRVSPRQTQKQTPKLASPLAPKAPTRLRAPQRQPLREKPVQITLLRTRPPPRPPKIIFAWPPDREPEKKKERKKEKSVLGFFLGNVPTSQIEGMFGRRREITLGKEKITRTLRGDARVLLGKSRTQKRTKKQEDMFGFSKKKTKFF
uniref:ORF6 n=1 Tax=Nitrosopumilaceae spindle-shaped virus TaxID=3065433 RepID=A0AAT9JGA8_9VIRU